VLFLIYSIKTILKVGMDSCTNRYKFYLYTIGPKQE